MYGDSPLNSRNRDIYPSRRLSILAYYQDHKAQQSSFDIDPVVFLFVERDPLGPVEAQQGGRRMQ
jgi:hypothetical protein